MRNKSPAFQFYPSDFLSDENVVLMSNQEAGCYIKLLCFCWKQGSVPNDTKKLAKLCGEDSESMATLWENIEPCFKVNGNGRLINPRLEKERCNQDKYHERQRKAGKMGAEKRWRNKDLNSTAIVSPMPNDSSSSSSSSSSSIKDKKITAKKDEFVFIFPVWMEPFKFHWEQFLLHRKTIRKPISNYAKHLAIKSIERLKDKGFSPDHVLNTCIEKGWQGIYEPKDEDPDAMERLRRKYENHDELVQKVDGRKTA